MHLISVIAQDAICFRVNATYVIFSKSSSQEHLIGPSHACVTFITCCKLLHFPPVELLIAFGQAGPKALATAGKKTSLFSIPIAILLSIAIVFVSEIPTIFQIC